MAEHVRHHNLGEIHHYWAPVFLNEHNVHLPDFVVFPPPRSRNADWEDLGTPLLAVEVLSPATAKHDRGAKRQRYQASGVAEYWIVDLDARLVERWRPGDQRPEISRDALTWQPVSAREPTMDLRQCFRSVLGA